MRSVPEEIPSRIDSTQADGICALASMEDVSRKIGQLRRVTVPPSNKRRTNDAALI